MRPVVVPFGRWPASGPVVTVATVLDDPARPSWYATMPAEVPGPARCRACRRRCRTPLRDGYGPKCWARLNAQPRTSARPASWLRAPRPANPDGAGPDLLDALADLLGGLRADLAETGPGTPGPGAHSGHGRNGGAPWTQAGSTTTTSPTSKK